MEFTTKISEDLLLETNAFGPCKLNDAQESDEAEDVEDACDIIMHDSCSNKSISSSDETPHKLTVRDMIHRFNIAAEAAQAENSSHKLKIKKRKRGSSLSDIINQKSLDLEKNNANETPEHVPQMQSQLSLSINNTYIESKATDLLIEKTGIEPVQYDETYNDQNFQEIDSHFKLYEIKESKNCSRMETLEPNIAEMNVEYQSKTTISKTTNGVRIVIDLLFDPSLNIADEVVGNRIETTLPQSKILNDLHEKINKSTSTAAANDLITYDASHC